MATWDSEANDLFLQALDIATPAERRAFIDRACAGNPARKADVEALLAAHEQAGSFLEPPDPGTGEYTPDPNASEPPPDPVERPGTCIGPYKLLQPIGEGGMGSVWMAEQERPVRRKVALKLIKAGMDSAQVIARFEAERQALAMMDHANIAKVLDAGTTAAGRPFFVMELVKGVPITKFCDGAKLTPRERLELFVPVCQAVQHAHQKGIIHRDLKPSNVLVALYDDRPVPKVIDFGVAKATGGKLTDRTMFTELGAVVGTLEYMAPEQASFNQLDIDTRADVYALGVILYELLTGSTPFDRKRLRQAAFDEMLRIIREEEPQKPSTKLSGSAELPSVAAVRKTEPKQLGKLMRGDLDWIVMKALEKDRGRRYETANGLSRDVQRYLADEAVEASPPSATYRLRKFVRRNRGPVAAVAAVALALVAGIAGFAWQAHVAKFERDRAVYAEGETKKRADELQLVSDFQGEMLKQVDPTAAGALLTKDVQAKFAAALTKAKVPEGEQAALVAAFAQQWQRVNATDAARDLIDRTILKPAVTAIDKQFMDQPTVDASLRQVLAERYFHLGLFESAWPLQKRALATRRRVLGAEHMATLQSIGNTGYLLLQQGKLSEAEPYLREAMEKSRRYLGSEHLDTLNLILSWGQLLYQQHKIKEAEQYFLEALAGCRRVLGEDHTLTLTAMGELGMVLMAQDKLKEAESYLHDVLAKRRGVSGEEHQITLTSILNVGSVLCRLGRPNEAEPYYREVLEKSRRVHGEEHPDTIVAICAVGLVLQAQDKLSEAEVPIREAMEKGRRVLGQEHPETLGLIHNMGSVLQDLGKLDEAEQCYREVLDKRRRIFGEDNPATVGAVATLGQLLMVRGKLDDAERYMRTAMEGSRRVSGDNAVDTLAAVDNLGKILFARAKPVEAEPYLREALDKYRRVLGEDHPDTILSLNHIGEVLLAQGKASEAEPYLMEAFQKNVLALPETHSHMIVTVRNVAALRVAQGKHDEAVRLLAPIEPAARKAFAKANVPRLAWILTTLGRARAGLREFAAAEPLLLEAYGLATKGRGATPQGERDCTRALFDLYTAWHAAEPGKGYDAKAVEWKVKLEAMKPPEPKPTLP